MVPYIQCQCFDKRRGDYLLEKGFFGQKSVLKGYFKMLIASVCAPPPGSNKDRRRRRLGSNFWVYNSGLNTLPDRRLHLVATNTCLKKYIFMISRPDLGNVTLFGIVPNLSNETFLFTTWPFFINNPLRPPKNDNLDTAPKMNLISLKEVD